MYVASMFSDCIFVNIWLDKAAVGLIYLESLIFTPGIQTSPFMVDNRFENQIGRSVLLRNTSIYMGQLISKSIVHLTKKEVIHTSKNH